MGAPLLALRGICKRFGASHALSGVDFSLQAGEIHALCGENGAGKSTLMNIIDGIHQPDAGEILLDGRVVAIDGPAQAMRLGIGLVHQEIALCGCGRAGGKRKSQHGGGGFQHLGHHVGPCFRDDRLVATRAALLFDLSQ